MTRTSTAILVIRTTNRSGGGTTSIRAHAPITLEAYLLANDPFITRSLVVEGK